MRDIDYFWVILLFLCAVAATIAAAVYARHKTGGQKLTEEPELKRRQSFSAWLKIIGPDGNVVYEMMVNYSDIEFMGNGVELKGMNGKTVRIISGSNLVIIEEV